MASNIIRKAITAGIFNTPVASIGKDHSSYVEKRWGAKGLSNAVNKSVVSPISSTGLGVGLINETIVRDEFVQAVFSGAILGKLQGIMEVPALTRVNVETAPVSAPFVGEYSQAVGFAGAFSFIATDKRKVGIVGVFSREMMLATGDAAEAVISAQVSRALSRGLDKAFVGSQVRDDTSPTGLASVATQAASFNAGILAFSGDLTTASILVNPLTATALRSPTEQQITAAGGSYGGLPVISSYAVPVGTLFIVDGSRVLAYIGQSVVDVATQASILLDDGTGTPSATLLNLFQSGQLALQGTQYVDWEFAAGCAVQVTLAS
jgi:hypothetical protein